MDAAHRLDASTFNDSVTAAQSALGASQPGFDAVVARLAGDERDIVADVAETATRVRQAETARLARLVKSDRP